MRNTVVAVVTTGLIGLAQTSVLSQELADQNLLLDAEQAFSTAQQAAEKGDFQAAIIALERVLIISPGLANIQFELGLLYKRVGALKRAEFLISESLKSPDMPGIVRERAESELASLSGKKQTGRFSFNVGLNFRSEDNPDSVPDRKEFFDPASQTYVTGISVEKPETEGTVNANAGLGYQRRFGPVAQHSWNTGLGVSTSRSDGDSESNTSDVRFDLGVTQALGTSTSTIRETFSPFVFYNLGYGESDLEDTKIGLGVRFAKNNPLWSLGLTMQASSERPEDNDNGFTNDVSASVNLRFKGAEGSKFTYGIAGNLMSSNASNPIVSYEDVGFSYSASYALESISSAPNSSITLSLGYGVRNYDVADLTVSESVRSDEKPGIGLSLRMPFSNGFSLSAGLNSQINRSNLANFRYENNSISVGMRWRF